MAVPQEKTSDKTGNDATATPKPDTHPAKIDRTAPAGTENSLGEESVRDGRPSTDDSTIEAKDEVGPDVTTSTAPDKNDSGR